MNNNNYYAERKIAQLQSYKPVTPPKPPHVNQQQPIVNVYPLEKYTQALSHKLDFSDQDITQHVEPFISKVNENKLTILHMATGTGKTPVTIASLGQIQKKLNTQLDFAIIAPKNIIQSNNWQQTINTYNLQNPDNQLKPYIIETIGNFTKQLLHPVTKTKHLTRLNHDKAILVIDEIQNYKNPTAQRTKQLHKLDKNKKIALTATPLTNNIIYDMASYLIIAGYYKNKTQFTEQTKLTPFLDKYNNPQIYKENGQIDQNKYPAYKTIKTQLKQIIYHPNQPIKKQLKLKNTQHIIKPSAILQDQIQQLEQAYSKRKYDSIKQYAQTIQQTIIDDPNRLNVLAKILTTPTTCQALIFYLHNHTLETLQNYLQTRKIQYQLLNGDNSIEQINQNKNIPILIQYQAGAEGIQFPNSNTTIFYENQYSHNLLQQAKGRNLRKNQTHSTINHHYLITQISLDIQTYNTLKNQQNVTTQTLKQILNITK